jgi:uncharacterized membrane protein
MDYIRELMGILGLIVDVAGVLIVFIGAALAVIRFFARPAADAGGVAFRLVRNELAKAILLGLEFLVAGDIIRTVAVSPTLQNVFVLGLIVLVRTFLSFTMQVEIEGDWPWRRAVRATDAPAAVP